MTNNLMPWAVLSLVVVVSLYWKGYLKMPSLAQPPAPPVALDNPVKSNPGPYFEPALMTSHQLAVLMAHAARREAEAEVAGQIAKDTADKLKATFAAPFSAGEPAPAAPVTPGV